MQIFIELRDDTTFYIPFREASKVFSFAKSSLAYTHYIRTGNGTDRRVFNDEQGSENLPLSM
jgi:hypothetical protein